MKRFGKGTGTIRKMRSNLICIHWIECQHRCPDCRKTFTHRVPWGERLFEWKWQDPCGIYFVLSHLPCPECMEFPMIFDGKRVVL